MLSEQAKQTRRAYKKQWNAKNKEKIKAAQDRYWEKKAREAATQTDEPKEA